MATYPGPVAPPPMDFRGAPEPGMGAGMGPDIAALQDLNAPPGGADAVPTLLRQASEKILQAAQAASASTPMIAQRLADVMTQIEDIALSSSPAGMPGPPGPPGMGPGGPPLPFPMRPPMLQSPAGMAPMGLPGGPR